MTLWYEAPLAAFAVAPGGQAGPDGAQGYGPGPGPGPGQGQGRGCGHGRELRPGRGPARQGLGSAALVVQPAAGGPVTLRRWRVAPDESRPGGCRAAAVLEELARALASQGAAGTPLVVLDAPRDLSLLDRELRRHRGRDLAGYLGGTALCVLDPLVLHRRLDGSPGPGARTLFDLCARYGATPADPPDTAGRAHAALEVVRAVGRRFASRLSLLTPAELHALQAVWHAAQARGAAWFAGEDPAGAADPAWPLRTEPPGEAA